MGAESIKLIANNKKAYHDYFIEDTYEAGISLHGTEVKSLRMGKCSVKESFVRIENGEVFIYGMHISPYEKGNIFNKDPMRVKKLLMHRYEINKIEGKIEKGAKVVVVEDLISTGGSVKDVILSLREAGAEVLGVVAIFTFLLPASSELFDSIACSFKTLSNYDVLIDVALENAYIKENDLEKLKAWKKDPKDESWMKK